MYHLLLYYYYRFMVHFPIGLDFLFIIFPHHFFMPCTSSLLISSSAISTSTLSNSLIDLCATVSNNCNVILYKMKVILDNKSAGIKTEHYIKM